jgi:hypothetical protein
MSTTEIRDIETDKYTVLTQFDSSNNLEIAIVQALVQSAYQQTTIDVSGGIYTSPANGSSWDCLSINTTDPSLISTSAISNYPAGTVTEYSVISSTISQDISLNTYTTNISSPSCSNNIYNFTTLSTSTPFYDANYVVTQNLLADCSDNQTGNFVNATFDVDASNAKIQYAMQSRWNTVLGPYNGLQTVGQDPTSIQQDLSDNVLVSFGNKGTGTTDASYQSYWYACGADGSLNSYLIDASYQPVNNNLLVGDRDLSGVTFDSNDVGIFRIQQASSIITTKVTLDSSTNFITRNDLVEMPLFNGYGINPLTYDASKSALLIPGNMTANQFTTLFNTEVYNTIGDDWTFTVDISSNNGGYYIDGSHTLISDLNNENLLDNPYYMENYVSNSHNINFSNSTVTVNESTDGTSTDASSITVNLSAGETLNSTYAGINGQIIINTNTVSTRYTDLSSVDVNGSYYPSVYYSNDEGTSISTAEMTNPYFVGMWQKVAQNSPNTDANYYLKSSRDAVMTLYESVNGIVDDYYNASDFDFSFNNTSFNDSDIQLWKITGSNNIIVNPQSLYTDPDYTIAETNFSTAGVIVGLTDDISYNTYRMLLTAKTKDDISLSTAVTNSNGWELNYTDLLDTYLTSDSNSANVSTSFPSQMVNSGIMQYLQAGNTINYLYTYYTVQDASSNVGGLTDYVDITYNFMGNQLITIPQSKITRTYNSSYTDVSYVVQDANSYSFSGTFFNKSGWELVYVTTTNRYDASFPASFGPYTNISLKVKDINQVNTFYAIINKSNQKFAPHSALQHVIAPGIPNLLNYNENISPIPGNTLQINGTLTKNDIKPFMSAIQTADNNDNWIDVGSDINMDVYYGLINVDNVLGAATVETIIEYSSVTTANSSLDLLNYYIPFVYDQSNNIFMLESFTASTSNIGSSTKTTIASTSFLNNTSYLTLTDGYNSVNTWDNNQYSLTIEHTYSSTTFIVKTLGNVEVFRIETLNNTVFLGTFFVSYIPQDYYRVERLLGSSSSSNTYSESFISTAYDDSTVEMSPTLQGVYITETSSTLSLSSNPTLGGYQSFRIIGDYMSINIVGTTSTPTSDEELGIASYNSGSLEFQDVSGSNYSAKFIFPKYRGYNSYLDTNTNQYYTITRGSTSVTFDVIGTTTLSALSDTLTSNMYYDEPFTVDNLQNTSNQLVANLNLKGSFNYSIPPSGSTLLYPVNVVGDTVNVRINNNNYIGDASNILVDPSATPVVNPRLYNDSMTLKDYGTNDEYTFSGMWYQTNNFMAIRPSRVKLNNTLYPYNTFSYEIKMLAQTIPVYKAKNIGSSITFNWFGNPALKGPQDPDEDVNDDWDLIDTYQTSSIILQNGGIKIGKKVLYQNPDMATGIRIVYFVSTPTYYEFSQISTDSCPTIPYNYNTQYLSNHTKRYMPFIDFSNGELSSVFNPFAQIVSYTDINGNTTDVTTDPDILNNVTFTLFSPPTMKSACLTSTYDVTRYGVIVPGTNLTVSEYVGDYPSTNSGSHTNPIWSGPVTSIPSIPNINNNSLILRSRDSSGGIYFSALQYPADIGYPSGNTGYQDIFHTDISSNWYNIDFYVGNSAWFNKNSPITYFNLNKNGITPTLYTVEDINNPLTQKNKRRVYKYNAASNIDIDISSGTVNGYQSFNLVFISREYHDFDITMSNTFPSTYSDYWNYDVLLNSTVIPNTQISWTVDASYSGNSYVSWAFGNSTTATKLLIDLFNVQDNQSKWTYIQLLPFMRYLNQFRMQVGSIAWDGSVTAPLVNTRVVSLAPKIDNPALQNNEYTIQQYSESTL